MIPDPDRKASGGHVIGSTATARRRFPGSASVSPVYTIKWSKRSSAHRVTARVPDMDGVPVPSPSPFPSPSPSQVRSQVRSLDVGRQVIRVLALALALALAPVPVPVRPRGSPAPGHRDRAATR